MASSGSRSDSVVMQPTADRRTGATLAYVAPHTEMTDALRMLDRLEIVTLVDNYTDILATSTERVVRHPLMADGRLTSPLVAEHGLSWLVDMYAGGERRRLICDFGWSSGSVATNVKAMSLCLADVEAAVLSHGHFDHFGGVVDLYAQQLIPRDAPLLLHPDAFNQRYLVASDGSAGVLPQLMRGQLDHLGVKVIEKDTPSLLASSMALSTGPVERVTDFEPGFPPQMKLENGNLAADTMMWDEQALVFKIKGKGLVVLSSCSHPGIINTILYAMKLTQENRLYAVIGGFHLSGPLFEPLIDKTIREIKVLGPEIVVPTHCTGMKAVKRFAEEMPTEFILNTVGARLCL